MQICLVIKLTNYVNKCLPTSVEILQANFLILCTLLTVMTIVMLLLVFIDCVFENPEEIFHEYFFF